MKRVISNRLSMYASVLSTMNSNQSAWNNVPVFAEAVAQFTQRLSDLKMELGKVQAVTAGIKLSRDARLDDARSLIIRLVKAFQVCGHVNNAPQLSDHYGFPVSLIRRWPVSELQVFAHSMTEDVQNYAAALMECGIVQEDLDHFNELVSAFPGLVSALRTAVINRSGINSHITDIDGELMEILHLKIDRLMVVLSEEHSDFAQAYHRARHTVDYGHSRNPSDHGDQAA